MRKNKYSMDFKREVVARVMAGESAEQVAKELKLSTSSLIYKWKISIGSAKAPKLKGTGKDKDAIVYLRHAKVAMTADLRQGRVKELSKSHLLTLLALETLING